MHSTYNALLHFISSIICGKEYKIIKLKAQFKQLLTILKHLLNFAIWYTILYMCDVILFFLQIS